MRLALGEAWASPVSPLLTAGLNGPKAGCAHVCLVPSRAKCTALLGIRTQPCTAVEQGSEPFKQEQELMSLTQGTSLMETGRKKTKTSHKEEVEMTKPN